MKNEIKYYSYQNIFKKESIIKFLCLSLYILLTHSCKVIIKDNPTIKKDIINDYEDALTNYLNLTKHDTSKIKQFEKFKFYNSNKIDGNGSIKGYNSAVSQIALNPISCLNDMAQWTLLGPNLYTDANNVSYNGLITSVIGDINNPNFYLMGTENSGVWKFDGSTTRGWRNVTDILGIPGLGITDIIVNPCNSNHIIASTGNHFPNVTIGVGIIESFDKGDTWAINNALNPQMTPVNYRYTELRVNDSKSNCRTGEFYYYAVKSIYGGSASDQNKILELKYHNNSTSINQNINTPTCNSNCATDPNCYWCHRDIYDIEVIDSNSFIVSSKARYTLETHLQVFNNGVWNSPISLPNNILSQKISISNIVNNICYISIDSASTRKFYKLDLISNQISFITSNNLLDANPSELYYSEASNLLYNGSGNFKPFSILNLNNTSQHKIFNDSNLHADIRGIYLLKKGSVFEEVLLATDGGISKVNVDVNNINNSTISDFSGTSMSTAQFFNIAVAQSNKERYLASAMHQGIFQKGMPSIDWHLIKVGDGISTLINPFNYNEFLYQGNNRIVSNTGFITPNNIGFHTGQKLISDPNNSDIAYWTRSGKYLSVYNFNTTSWIHHFQTSNIDNLGAIDISKTNNDIYVANSSPSGNQVKLERKKSLNFGVFQPFDLGTLTINGQTKTLREHLSYKRINDIAVHPKNENVIYLAISGVVTDSNSNAIPEKLRVLKTTDGGSTWIDRSTGLDATPCNSLIFQEGTNGRLFLSNEFGVFYIDDSFNDNDPWKCFHAGLPPRVITDLSINYCTNELLASTFGNAIWKTTLNTLTSGTSEQEISNNTTWDNIKKVQYGDLRIKSGVTLNIVDSSIKFGKNASVIVEPGGNLEIDNSTLTSLCEDSCWNGITVEGNSNLPQTVLPSANQGFAFIKNSTISNAKSALNSNGKNESNGGVAWDENGGKLKVLNTTFINNRRAISFLGYENRDLNNIENTNLSEFIDCNFIIDDNYSSSCGSNEAFVTLLHVNGVKFEGCRFIDSRSTGLISANDYRSGIYGLESTIIVVSNNSTNRKSVFTNLNKGIHLKDVDHTNDFEIEILDSEFNNCQTGIRFEYINNESKILRNKIKIGHPSNDDSYGIVPHSSSGFRIENNDCEKDNTNFSGWTHGFDIAYTINSKNPILNPHFGHNIIKNNISRGNNVGFKAWGSNVANNGNGLEFLCNENINNINSDFWLLSPIQSQQGTSTAPAGNIFTCNGVTPFDVDFSAPPNGITYFQNGTYCHFDNYFNVQNINIPRNCN